LSKQAQGILDIFTRIDELLTELIDIEKQQLQIFSQLTGIEPAETKPLMTIDPFKLAEWMGWGWGIFKQAIFRLPASAVTSLTIDVPDDEVWWFTYSIIGDIPSSSITTQATISCFEPTPKTEVVDVVCAHEGWVGTPFCPPGWHKAEGPGSLRMIITNVTGDVAYNDLPLQEVFIHYTLLIFKIDKEKEREMSAYISKLVESMEE